jgi:hypothetical protein
VFFCPKQHLHCVPAQVSHAIKQEIASSGPSTAFDEHSLRSGRPPRNDRKLLKQKLSSRTETRAKLTRYHSDSTHSLFKAWAQHSLDDGHHPVPVTENNSGLLTFSFQLAAPR